MSTIYYATANPTILTQTGGWTGLSTNPSDDHEGSALAAISASTATSAQPLLSASGFNFVEGTPATLGYPGVLPVSATVIGLQAYVHSYNVKSPASANGIVRLVTTLAGVWLGRSIGAQDGTVYYAGQKVYSGLAPITDITAGIQFPFGTNPTNGGAADLLGLGPLRGSDVRSPGFSLSIATLPATGPVPTDFLQITSMGLAAFFTMDAGASTTMRTPMKVFGSPALLIR